MLSLFKRLRVTFGLYNFFQKKRLVHNLPLYKKYGIKKKYFSSVSSKDFAQVSGVENHPDHTSWQQDTTFLQLSKQDQLSLEQFENEGYAILRGFFTEEKIDDANRSIDELIKSGKVKFKYGNRIMFAMRHSEVLKGMGNDERLVHLLSLLIGTRPVLFQSINFLKGSEQDTHSDSIHMTTFPLGKLIAVWVALEDISTDNGPLHYYPGSHLLPYYLNSDYDNEGNKWMIGDKTYTEYENMIEEKIRQSGLSKKIFEARKGDILIWHANLFHGGEPHINKSKTRKSMVFHYFGEDAICYHEITQRPALI